GEGTGAQNTALLGERYRLGPRIGAGGMGQVNIGLMTGAAAFSRTVAIKRLHPEYLRDPLMAARFAREVWLSARIRHPNVVQVLDVIQQDEELLFVMEYVPGDTLRSLGREAAKQGVVIPLEIASGILTPALHGLHAAHETRDDSGKRLGLVHRDFSPDNVMIGPDGEVKVLDFGIAKASLDGHTSRTGGGVPGKLGYFSPEQATGSTLDARSDVFAAGTVLWETLVGARLFRGNQLPNAAVLNNLLHMQIPPPSRLRADVPEALDRVVLRALERDVEKRFQSALDFAMALEAAIPPASPFHVGQWSRRFCEPRSKQRETAAASLRQVSDTQHLLDVTEAFASPDAFTEMALAGSTATRPAAARAHNRRLRLALGISVVLASLGMLGWLGKNIFLREQFLVPKAAVAAAGSEQPMSVVSPTPPSAPPSAQPAPPAPKSVAVTPSASMPSASMSVDAPSPRPAPREKRASRRRPDARSTPPARAACDPPTYLDEDGIRHFKTECL
ncbi:MAG TPA: serine/threonine-protein kinase, partial [Polyangiaceae bacterium]